MIKANSGEFMVECNIKINSDEFMVEYDIKTNSDVNYDRTVTGRNK